MESHVIGSDGSHYTDQTLFAAESADGPHAPSLPMAGPAEEIRLSLLELANARPSDIELELALNRLHKSSKVGLKVLRETYGGIKSEVEQQQAQVQLTDEERQAIEQAERVRHAEQEDWNRKVAQRANEIAACPTLIDLLKSDLKKCHGYLASESLAGTILLSHGARYLPKSMGFVFSGPSASGKSEAVIKASNFLPPEVIINSTTFSEKSLYYLGSISGKYVVGGEIRTDEPSEDDPMQQAFRQLISENKITRTIVEPDEFGVLKSVTKETEGPVSFSLTTTREQQEFNDEFANRLSWHSTSDDPELTAAVLNAQAESAARPPAPESRSDIDLEIEAWQTYHRNLTRFNVVVPFAKQIIPTSLEVTMRRLYPMVLNYIKSLALLHQANRKTVGNGSNPYVIAELEDYENAYKLATANAPRVLDILSERMQKLYERLCVHFTVREFTRADAQVFLKLTKSKASRVLRELKDAGCIVAANTDSKAYKYKMVDVQLSMQDLGLVPPEQVVMT